MTFIGRSLDEAKCELESNGYSVEVVRNSEDRMKRYDAVLVTNEVYDGMSVKLTVAPFQLEVDEI